MVNMMRSMARFRMSFYLVLFINIYFKILLGKAPNRYLVCVN